MAMPLDAQSHGRHGRRWAAGFLVVLLAAAIGVWWWSRPPDVVPPMPADVEDAEVAQAVETARADVLERPRAADAWGQLGKVLLAHLFDREARFCFAEAARLDPADPRWFYGQAVIALKRDPDNAVRLLEQALAATDPAWPQYRSVFRLQLAEAHLERWDLDAAEKLFREVQDSEPANPRAALGLGQLEAARGNDQLATLLLTRARASKFARKTATAQLASLARARDDKDAADAFQQEWSAAADDPPWPDPLLDEIVRLQVGRRGWERRVGLLEQHHHYEEAAQEYLQEIERRPSVQAYVGAGINLARLRRYEEALPLLREGVRRGPDSAHAHYSLALALFSRAEREWQTAPRTAQLTDWFREAETEARKAAELRPEHARAYLFWGLSLKYLGDPAAAVAPLRQGVACQPGDLELQLGLGEVLLETGQLPLAKTHLENAARINPSDPRPARALERLREKAG
jgi:Flp pilus assembly protein TadD